MADQPRESAQSQRGFKFYLWIALVVVAAIFILQNTQEVEVKFFFSTTHLPLVFALLLVALLGFLIGLALPRLRRRHD